ncbi:hypothetical protein XI06_33510 [Bradyrhizobium sp. CCBAU 11434]|uniref:hypothetical protein n=1 Tax=Bradyrhizobium TaxID=374 RepID=UPI001EDA11AD|nr:MULTISPECIES: hypothetical protein [Bradyrhizobium]MCG2641967.1 hypothetical protein [Bradyrhizobium zhengyangense]MDA9525090.1 hypothetical protein [Bradyrhizobium sp. CCBAU 11434]
MGDHPIFDALASWPGRVPTQRAFEARGFLIPAAWQNRMIEFCGASQAELLNRYWDEVAMETMRSVGKVQSDLRRFLIEPRYRSAFLDDLFARKDFVDPAVPNGPLIKGLLDHFKRAWSDQEFRDKDIAFRRELQKRECARLGIQTTGWTGKKRGIIPFIDEFCVALAFKRRRNRWHKRLDCGLVFEVGLDLGGDPQRVGAPLVFRILHESDSECVFEMGGNEAFDRLIYGSRLYWASVDPDECILGIRAYIELFDVIAASFGASQKPSS